MMQVDKSSEAGPKRKAHTKILKLALAVFCILILLAVFLPPAFVSSEKGREIILTRINDSIDGRVNFAAVSMGWFRGLEVTDFSFNDGTGQTLIKARQITTKPHYGSILFGRLSLGKTIIDQPTVQINLKARQLRTKQNLRQEASADKTEQPIALPIRKIDLVIRNGSLKVVGSETQAAEIAEINSEMTLSFSGKYPAGQTKTLPVNLEAKAGLNFAEAKYMGWNFGPTETEIQIRNGLLKVASFSSEVNNGRLNFTGQADFKEKPVLLKTIAPIHIAEDIEINNQITRKLLMYLNPIFANAVNVSGIVNFNCEQLAIPLTAADKNDIEVIGTISVSQLRLQASDLLGQILSLIGSDMQGQDITIHPTRFIVQKGLIRYDNMQVDIGDNPVNFKGVIGLDKSLNMTVTLPYTLKGKTVRAGEEKVGERVTLSLRGTVDKPELDLGKLLEQQLKEQLQMQLKKELGNQLGNELEQKILEGLEELLK